MRMKRIFTCLLAAAAGIAVAGAQNNGNLAKVSNVFPGKFIESFTNDYGESSQFTYNDQSQLVKVGMTQSEKTTFSYVGGTYEGFTYDATSVDTDGESTQTLYIKLNEKGFATEMLFVDVVNSQFSNPEPPAPDIEKAVCVYDNDGHLTKMTVTDGDRVTVFDFTWTNGNLVKTVSTETEPGAPSEVTTYVTSYDANLTNASGFMEFETFSGADMDQFSEPYFAGMLGKGTANLPVKIAEEGEPTEYEEFVWEVDAEGYPVKFTVNTYSQWGNETDVMQISWKGTTGVSNVATDTESTAITGWYDSMGVRHDAPVKGINIARRANGTSIKIVK